MIGVEQVRVISALPVGSPNELEALGWDPRAFGSCSKPVQGENLGCSMWPACKMSYRGKPGPEGGVHNHGCRILKSAAQGSGHREVGLPCYSIPLLKANIEAGGGVFEIICDEGPGSELYVGGSRMKEGGDPKDPSHRVMFENEKVEVPAFPRPQDNPAFHRHRLGSSILARARREHEINRVNRALGLGKEPAIDETTNRQRSGARPGGRPTTS